MSDETDDPLASVDTGEPPPPVVQVRPPAPPQRRRRSRARYRLRRAIALFALVVIGFGAWFAWSLWQPFAGAGSGTVVVTIPPRTGTRAIGDLLARDGVVDSGFFFFVRAVLDGDRAKLLPRTYHLRRGMSYSAALHALTTRPPVKRRPVVATVKLTIPEGFRRDQIAGLAHAKGVVGSYYVATRRARGFHPRSYGAPRHLRNLEGFLFPATYPVERGESAATLVSQQLLAFEQNFDGLDFAHAKAAGLSRFDVVIIASLIQSEAQVPGDFRLVSAVIYNRLHQGMTLGIDATLRYYLHDYTHQLTESQLQLNTPYNTRLHHGLPPTPISNPGLAAMTAAADPAKVTYLYYVFKPYTCGKLAFATTYTHFLREKAAYDEALRKNGNRQPTRCP